MKAGQDFTRFALTSRRKRMSTVISNATGEGDYDKRLLVRGASELILASCSHFLASDGQRFDISDDKRGEINEVINREGQRGRRTVVVAYRDLEPGQFGDSHDAPAGDNSCVKDAEKSGLTFVSVVGLEDILRPGAQESMQACLAKGISVRMVTGDNIIVSKEIAKQCGITSEGDLADEKTCMEGAELIEMLGGAEMTNLEECKAWLPSVKVVARTTPD